VHRNKLAHRDMTLWVIRAGLRLGHSPIHVRSTPDSDRKFKARLFGAMCHKETYAVQQKSLLDHLHSTRHAAYRVMFGGRECIRFR
jgi:hypothetical protein